MIKPGIEEKTSRFIKFWDRPKYYLLIYSSYRNTVLTYKDTRFQNFNGPTPVI